MVAGSFVVLVLLLSFVEGVTLLTVDNSTECPDGITEFIDYGDLTQPGSGRVLEIRGKDFYVYGDKVFLSGASTPFIHRGYDFGNNYYQGRRHTYECFLRKIHQAGGNTMRTWVHDIGERTPHFDSTGHVIGLDKKGTFISDLRQYLRAAAHYDVVVFLTLWDSKWHHQNMDSLIENEDALQSYIDNALIPLVKALKDEPGLGGYEIHHRFEGVVRKGLENTEPCFDTRRLNHIGGGWAHEKLYTMQDLLRFISRQADAIRNVDPTTPVTAGSPNMQFNTEQFGYFNYHKDECLLKAGGRPQKNASDFQLDKPLVIGTFTQHQKGLLTSQEMFQWAYHHGYNGAWSWMANYKLDYHLLVHLATQMLGMDSIRSKKSNGRVEFSLSKYAFVNRH